MTNRPTASELLDRHFLEMRARLLEMAATLDRMDRAGSADDDPRMQRIRQGIQHLLEDGPDRAERIQLLFSRNYEADWRQKFNL